MELLSQRYFLLNNLPVSALIFNKKGDLIECNRQALDFVGLASVLDYNLNRRIYNKNIGLFRTLIVDLEKHVGIIIITAEHFLISYFNILYVIRFRMPVSSSFCAPNSRHIAIQVFNHIGSICCRFLYINGKCSCKSCSLAKLKKVLNAKTIGRILIPVALIRRSKIRVTNHFLETVFRSIHHSAAISKERQSLGNHCCTNVIPIWQTFKLLVACLHQCHLINPNLARILHPNGKSGLCVGGIRSQGERIFRPDFSELGNLLGSIGYCSISTL